MRMKSTGKEQFYKDLQSFIWGIHPEESKHLAQNTKTQVLKHHSLCQQLFCNAHHDRLPMYIQINKAKLDEGEAVLNEQSNDGKNIIYLQCSLLTDQMLAYDRFIFNAMQSEDDAYRHAAQGYFRPYFFSFIARVDKEKYEQLRRIRDESGMEENDPTHLWFLCSFNNIEGPLGIRLEGEVIQSASPIESFEQILYIYEHVTNSSKLIKDILDVYKLRPSVMYSDKSFTDEIEKNLAQNYLSYLDIYKIGDGNCIFAQGKGTTDRGFFYDIGFDYKHRPKKPGTRKSYKYSNSIKKIRTMKPDFFILSHWDMDHIAGIAYAPKSFFFKKWFAPDCYDACMDAGRLAKFLDMNDCLMLAERGKAHLIGQIDVTCPVGSGVVNAEYKLYIGEKTSCDSSKPNCEGIVIAYRNRTMDENVLMMGDVNYKAFDLARGANGELQFSDTHIDYLVAPHHGSEHTGYMSIVNKSTILLGEKAVICCTNNQGKNRPNKLHLQELEKRFHVITTEEAHKEDPDDVKIRILLK